MIYRFAGSELDTDLFQLSRNQESARLTPRVFGVLVYLIRHRERVVTKAELIDSVWGTTAVTEASLPQCITQVRRAVGQARKGPPVIETVYGRGYRFVAQVQEESTEPVAAPPRAAVDPERTVPGFSGRPAIAILPFDNLSEDAGQDYFVDGFVEDLTTRLASWRWFPVIARNSAFAYRGRAVDLKQVGTELGVRYVVEGSVRRAADRVRINAQLIETTSGHHIWAQRYDREIGDIFAVQDEISETIVGAIEPELRKVELDRVARRPPENLDAWDCFLRGNMHLFRYTAEDNVAARDWFRKALEIDERFAPALSMTSITHLHDLTGQWTDSPRESARAAVAAAERSVALDEWDPYGHATLGGMLTLSGQKDRALASFARASEINPSFSLPHWGLGRALSIWGEPEAAVSHFHRAIRLSPHDPFMFHFLEGLAFAHFIAEQYDEAAVWAERSIRRRSDWARAHRLLAASYGQLGRIPEAGRALDEMLRLQPRFSVAELRESYVLSRATPDFVESYVEGLRRAGFSG